MLADFPVQLASEVHATQIAELSRDYVEYGLGWSWTRRRVLASIRNRETNVCVIVDQAVVNAFGIMTYSERHAHLVLLAVRPASRRKGLASAIVEWLESVARVAGADRILVECRRSNDAARLLYLNHHYHELKIMPAMYSGYEDGIRLEKWLRQWPEADKNR